MQIITNAEVRSEVLAALEKAKASEAPILEFSNTMTALYRSSVDWNIRRISAVFGYVLESTGIDLRSVRGTQMETPPRPISDRPTSEVVVPSPRTAMPVAPASEDVSRLRQMIKDAIDMMNVRDLLEMKLPVESLYAVMTRRLGERS
jgi:hypothetical protein